MNFCTYSMWPGAGLSLALVKKLRQWRDLPSSVCVSMHKLDKSETVTDQHLSYVWWRNSLPSFGMCWFFFFPFIPLMIPETVFEDKTTTAFLWMHICNWGELTMSWILFRTWASEKKKSGLIFKLVELFIFNYFLVFWISKMQDRFWKKTQQYKPISTEVITFLLWTV